MNTEQGKLGSARRRGDGLFVTLLFVVAVPLAAAVFAFTHLHIASADTIRSYVPRNAVAYLHAGGRPATEALLSTSAQMPSGIRPDEVAVFAVPGDDSLRWSVIVAWRRPRSPSPDELRILDERGAEPLDAGRFLIGDGTLATAVKVAAAAHASLADDREKSAALDLVRSVSATQLYADPAALLPPETLFALAELSEDGLPPLVAGINYSAGSFTARIMTVTDAAARSSFLGYSETSIRGKRLGAGRLNAEIAVAETAPSFDLAKLLLGTPSSGDHPSPAMLSDAGSALRDEFSTPYALWLRTDPKTGSVSYLLHFPELPPSRARTAVARYFAAAEPSREVMTLPDGDLAVEFHLDEPIPGTGATSDVAISVPKSSGLDQLLVGSDGAGGSLVASSAALVTEFRSKTDTEPPHENAGCSSRRLKAVIHLLKPSQTLGGITQLKDYFATLGINELTVGLTVDNEVLVCG